MYSLYRLTFSNGKSYIGQTVRAMNTRIAQHGQMAKAGSLLPVHCAWRMHGKPEVKVVSEHSDTLLLHEAEKAAIIEFKTLAPDGYNLSHGGDTAPSKNPDVAAKISAKAKGRKHENTESWSAASKRQWSNPEYREKVISAVKSSWTEEKRKARSEKSKAMWADKKSAGWKMPESTKDKLSIAGSNRSSETRAKMSASAKRRARAPRTPETCARLSASIKASWQNPEIRAARSAAIREGHKKAAASRKD